MNHFNIVKLSTTLSREELGVGLQSIFDNYVNAVRFGFNVIIFMIYIILHVYFFFKINTYFVIMFDVTPCLGNPKSPTYMSPRKIHQRLRSSGYD